MTLPSSGPLSLSDIKGEFGGPTSPSLSNYYAGGAYVPSGTSGTNGPVPTSGAISISSFYGTSNFLQQITMGVGNSGGSFPLYGYSASIGFGSISSSGFFAGGSFEEFWWNSSNNNLVLSINTTGISQSAFTTVEINASSYGSAAASFLDDGSTCTWTWVSGNPIGISGSITCTFQ